MTEQSSARVKIRLCENQPAHLARRHRCSDDSDRPAHAMTEEIDFLFETLNEFDDDSSMVFDTISKTLSLSLYADPSKSTRMLRRPVNAGSAITCG